MTGRMESNGRWASCRLPDGRGRVMAPGGWRVVLADGAWLTAGAWPEKEEEARHARTTAQAHALTTAYE